MDKPKQPDRSLPIEGEPNSDLDLNDSEGTKQRRHYGHYGPDGKAQNDIDYRHADPKNTHEFPHKHKWDWNDPSNPIRSKPIPIEKEIFP